MLQRIAAETGETAALAVVRDGALTYVAEATDRFIIGDLDIDAEWDAYVAQLGRIGLGRYLKILEDNL